MGISLFHLVINSRLSWLETSHVTSFDQSDPSRELSRPIQTVDTSSGDLPIVHVALSWFRVYPPEQEHTKLPLEFSHDCSQPAVRSKHSSTSAERTTHAHIYNTQRKEQLVSHKGRHIIYFPVCDHVNVS